MVDSTSFGSPEKWSQGAHCITMVFVMDLAAMSAASKDTCRAVLARRWPSEMTHLKCSFFIFRDEVNKLGHFGVICVIVFCHQCFIIGCSELQGGLCDQRGPIFHSLSYGIVLEWSCLPCSSNEFDWGCENRNSRLFDGT